MKYPAMAVNNRPNRMGAKSNFFIDGYERLSKNKAHSNESIQSMYRVHRQIGKQAINLCFTLSAA
jgi:hypothetical protein